MTTTDPRARSTGTTGGGSAVDPDLEPGETVGEYVIEGKLGQGGFGAVFKASHPLIGKLVAIKVLARRFSVDPEMVERFQAEARAVNQIRHRHIIDIFSFGGLADGRAYYVMEYLDGETLGDKLMRETRLELEVALPILRAIARALDAAHAKGIAHRDLKPDNVFLARGSDPNDGEDFAKLLDFGIAKLLRAEDGLKSKTQTGIPMGTPYYMSPEQCRGRDVDHRTDYYAFGVVAYELLTGTFPIDGEDYMTVLMKQIAEDAPPASSRYEGLPPGVDQVLAWLMRKDPADRPPSLAAAMSALDAAAADVGIAVPRAPRSSPVVVPPHSRVQSAMATPAGMVAPAPLVTPMPTMPPEPARPGSRRGALIGGAVGAVVIGGVMFAMLGGSAKQDEPAPPPPKPATAVVVLPVSPPDAAPAPAPAPATPTPAPVAPVAPAVVTLTITDAPDGTIVHDATGKELGRVPTVQLPKADQDVVLTLDADGFKSTTVTVRPTGDVQLSVKLVKKPHAATHPVGPPATPHTPGNQNSIEDPFAK